MPDRPIVVCLCGSTRFRDAFESAMRAETLAGKVVLSVGLFGHLEGLDMDGPTKRMLDELHLRKIDMASEVYFLNLGGYLGPSTRRELAYARSLGKVIRFLEPESAPADPAGGTAADRAATAPHAHAPDPEADRRRLDWLEAWDDIEVCCEGSAHRGEPPLGYTVLTRHNDETDPARSGRGPTLRAAIDAAMAGRAARGGETA